MNEQVLSTVLHNTFGVVRTTRRREWQIDCPSCAALHNDHQPDGRFNLTLNPEKGMFMCWKCDMKGHVSNLIRKYGTYRDYLLVADSAPKVELTRGWEQIFGHAAGAEPVQPPLALPKEFIPVAKASPSNRRHGAALDYLFKTRKVSEQAADRFKLGFCTEGRYWGRVVVPSWDGDGAVNYFTTRTYIETAKPKYLNPWCDRSRIIFNESGIDFNALVFVVEGPFDMLAVPANTTILLGKSLTHAFFAKAERHATPILFALDPDAAADQRKMLRKLAFTGLSDRMWSVAMTGDDDLADHYAAGGRQAVSRILRTAAKHEG